MEFQIYSDQMANLLKTNGYMLIDNMLWAGGTKPPDFTTSIENAASYEAYLSWVANDPTLEIVYSS